VSEALARRLVEAARRAFPESPEFEDDRETTVGYEKCVPEPAADPDPFVPKEYFVPVLGDAEPIARAAVEAVLIGLASANLDGHTAAFAAIEVDLLRLVEQVRQVVLP